MVFKRECRFCEKEFESVTPKKATCSKACYNKLHRAQHDRWQERKVRIEIFLDKGSEEAEFIKGLATKKFITAGNAIRIILKKFINDRKSKNVHE